MWWIIIDWGTVGLFYLFSRGLLLPPLTSKGSHVCMRGKPWVFSNSGVDWYRCALVFQRRLCILIMSSWAASEFLPCACIAKALSEFESIIFTFIYMSLSCGLYHGIPAFTTMSSRSFCVAEDRSSHYACSGAPRRIFMLLWPWTHL